MKKVYRWDRELGKLVLKRLVTGLNIVTSDTYQVGDLPDIQKDIDSRKRDKTKADRVERRTAIVAAVDSVSSIPEAATYNDYVERENKRYE